jgi:hypothetical protein
VWWYLVCAFVYVCVCVCDVSVGACFPSLLYIHTIIIGAPLQNNEEYHVAKQAEHEQELRNEFKKNARRVFEVDFVAQ